MERTAKCSLLICGATFAGLGAALAALEAKRNVIVVERTALVGREFIETFNPGTGWSDPTTELVQSFRNDLITRNLMENNGPVHLPGLHPLLCQLIKQFGLKIKFLTEIVGVAEQDGSYVVHLHDASGSYTLLADEIWDTSSQRLTVPGSLFVPERKRLNAYLHHPDIRNTGIPSPIDDSMSVRCGRFQSEVILKVEVAPEDDLRQARQRLVQFWQNRPEEWASWTIAAIASGFESTVAASSEQLAERWSWLPSEALSNPLSALDQGYVTFKKAVSMHGAAISK